MADDDDLYDDDEASSGEDGDLSGLPGADDSGGGGSASPFSRQAIKEWMNRRRGWILICGLAIAQAAFASIMIYLRSGVRPVVRMETQAIRDLAVDMLGHEVKFNQIYQLIPLRGGKKMTIGLDVSLILGQLPEERIEGAPYPTPEEMELFVQAVRDMEPRIRSRVNSLLQQMPREDYGTVDMYPFIKNDLKKYINDSLAGLDFGKGVRKEINKRRVTDILLPMFIRQMM